MAHRIDFHLRRNAAFVFIYPLFAEISSYGPDRFLGLDGGRGGVFGGFLFRGSEEGIRKNLAQGKGLDALFLLG
jgi:hypothetical protein